jgi:hypothetical protein
VEALRPVIQTIPQARPRSIVINSAVAIEFFSLAKNRDLYLSSKKRDAMSSYYELLDQHGIYQDFIVPVLDSLEIPVVDTIPDDVYIIFEDSTQTYIINIDRLKSEDGVLLYAPGKKPVFWQEKNMRLSCLEPTFIHCYFGK